MKAPAWGPAGLATVLLLAAGCNKPDPTPQPAPAPSVVGSVSAPEAASTPVDHLAPGELVQGTEEAFGLMLPTALHVEQRSPGVVAASGSVLIPDLVTYLRERLVGGVVHRNDEETRFENVKPRTKPDGPALNIRVSIRPLKTYVEIVQIPVYVPSTLPDEASRWRAVGLTPKGAVLDPQHTE